MNIYEWVLPKRWQIVGFKRAALICLMALGTDQMPHVPLKKPMVKSLLSVRAGFPGAWIVSSPHPVDSYPLRVVLRQWYFQNMHLFQPASSAAGDPTPPSLRGMLVAIGLEIFWGVGFRSKQQQ